jgi:hypothetical protein
MLHLLSRSGTGRLPQRSLLRPALPWRRFRETEQGYHPRQWRVHQRTSGASVRQPPAAESATSTAAAPPSAPSRTSASPSGPTTRRIRWGLVRPGRPLDPRTEILQLTIKVETGEAFAVASNNEAYIEGAHADHLLYSFDEAKPDRNPAHRGCRFACCLGHRTAGASALAASGSGC